MQSELWFTSQRSALRLRSHAARGNETKMPSTLLFILLSIFFVIFLDSNYVRNLSNQINQLSNINRFR